MSDATGELVSRIRDKRAQLDEYTSRMSPRKRRLVSLTLLGGLAAAALTTGPAVGGETFTQWMSAGLGWSTPAWQVLCGGAALCSLVATGTTQFLQTHHIEENVARAVSNRAKLEALELSILAGHIDLTTATAEYIRCVEDTALL